jgi:hypothetical protein
MLYLIAKRALSGIIIAAASEGAKPDLWSVPRLLAARLNFRDGLAMA